MWALSFLVDLLGKLNPLALAGTCSVLAGTCSALAYLPPSYISIVCFITYSTSELDLLNSVVEPFHFGSS